MKRFDEQSHVVFFASFCRFFSLRFAVSTVYIDDDEEKFKQTSPTEKMCNTIAFNLQLFTKVVKKEKSCRFKGHSCRFQ